MDYTLRFIFCCSLSVLTFGLQSCTTLFGTGPHARISVPADVFVTDLSTGQKLNVYRATTDSYFVVVPNGKRYAFRFDYETKVGYHLLEPTRDYWTLLGLMFYGTGIVVDHLSRSFYTYPEQGAVKPTFVPVDQQKALEDRLKLSATWMTPTSVIDNRDTLVIVPYYAGSHEWLLYRDATYRGSQGIGVGIQICPAIMPFLEAGVIGNRPALYNRPWYALGVHLQEPDLGLCGALRFGHQADNPSRQFGSPSLYAVGSGGIYGQWGRLELRYKHILSWHSLPEDPVASFGFLGMQYSFHIFL